MTSSVLKGLCLDEGLKHTRQEHVLNPLLTSQTVRGINRGRLMNLRGLSFVPLLTSWRLVFRHSGRSQVASHRSCCSKLSLCQELGSEKLQCGTRALWMFLFQARSHTRAPTSVMPSCIRRPRREHMVPCLSFPFRIPKVLVHTTLFCRENLCKPARRQRGLKNSKQGRALLSWAGRRHCVCCRGAD